MTDHISKLMPSKRKHFDGKGDQQQDSSFDKKHKISKKKDKGKQDPVGSQHTPSATEATAVEHKNSSTSLQDATKPENTTTSLPAAPNDVTRSVLAFGLLPRQVARAPARKPRVPASTSSTTVTSTTLKTSTTTTAATTTKFRARDIMADVKSSKSTSTFRDSTIGITSSTTTAAITTVSTPSSEAIVTSKSTLIKAEPLFVIPDNNPNRYEFPYGNYPNYYEKRIQEQTKRRSKPAPSSASTSAFKHSAGDRKSVQVWDKVWENQTDEAYYQRKHFRLSATPTVLFPAGCIKYTSESGSTSSTKKGSRGSKRISTKLTETRVTLVDLAKKVDLRLEFLDPSWFRGKRVLDIGCNSALLTVFIALHYKPQKIQGVDIDPSLIGKAQKFVLKTFSQLSSDAYTQTMSGSPPPTTTQETSPTGLGHQRENDVPYEEYFPKALQKIHGTLPVPKRTERTEHLFPHNIELQVSDWVTESDEIQDIEQGQGQKGQDKWDVILGFSLTKWIHLHHGDEGLKKFFHKVYRNLTPGGVFLVEPQDYATYVKRSKITPEMKKTYDGIKFRPEEFQDYLVKEVGFRESQHLGQSDGHAKNFNRDIFLFRK
ncbi:Bin3-domain-containing protein [Linnemannia elongata AG-77]|uniref:RNA methyltransferase n=2 Tax=Linnemannia elongata AG-77 TaxID=1314771 RepID=A0A197JF48_9FUNG|nr:Bin3-domain-containing protein [Linnemannia elongata AG-77]